MDSLIKDRVLSLKVLEQQIRKNHDVKSAEATRTSNREIGEHAIISEDVVSAVVAIAILTLRS